MTELDRIETSDNPKLTLEQLVISKDLPCTMRTIQQEIRYCTECSKIKPDRAHHCGVCGQCVLKVRLFIIAESLYSSGNNCFFLVVLWK